MAYHLAHDPELVVPPYAKTFRNQYQISSENLLRLVDNHRRGRRHVHRIGHKLPWIRELHYPAQRGIWLELRHDLYRVLIGTA